MTATGDLQKELQAMWQKVPNEERDEILTRAQGKALDVCIMVLGLGCGAALGLDKPIILLGALILTPLIFQIVSAKFWAQIKPQTIIRYFLASLAAKHFAGRVTASNTELKLIFRGSLESIDTAQNTLNAEAEVSEFVEEIKDDKAPAKDVWISLFSDSLIMISENEGGAKLEFSHATLPTLLIELDTPEDFNGNPLPSRLILGDIESGDNGRRWMINSQHRASLLACERKLRFLSKKIASERSHSPLQQSEIENAPRAQLT